MEKKELELIDQMPKIKQFHNMNKGMQSLIQQLIKISKYNEKIFQIHFQILLIFFNYWKTHNFF